MKNLFILFIVSIVLSSELFSAGIDIQEIEVEQIYYFRLVNGDVITARVLEKNIDNEQFFIKINTIIGTATIFENEIVEIRKISQIYRHNNRIFLLPTALPIDNHHFVGNFELGFFYAGIGIWDYFSLMQDTVFYLLHTLTRKLVPLILNFPILLCLLKIFLPLFGLEEEQILLS